MAIDMKITTTNNWFDTFFIRNGQQSLFKLIKQTKVSQYNLELELNTPELISWFESLMEKEIESPIPEAEPSYVKMQRRAYKLGCQRIFRQMDKSDCPICGFVRNETDHTSCETRDWKDCHETEYEHLNRDNS